MSRGILFLASLAAVCAAPASGNGDPILSSNDVSVPGESGKEECGQLDEQDASQMETFSLLQVDHKIQKLQAEAAARTETSRGASKGGSRKVLKQNITNTVARGDKVFTSVEIPAKSEHNATESIRKLAKAVFALDGCGIPQLKEKAGWVLGKIVNESWTAQQLLGDQFFAGQVEQVEACALSSQSAATALANNMEEMPSDFAAATGRRDEDYNSGAFQGDMMPSSVEQLMLFQKAWREGRSAATAAVWPSGVVKYCFADDAPESVRHIFQTAIVQFHRAMPCLTFEDVGWQSGNSSTSPPEDQRCQEGPAIFVQANTSAGCYSYVGMVSTLESQQLQLKPGGCVHLGIAMHELGHALGMFHEQSRSDREESVRINWENIEPGKESNFVIHEGGYTDVDYDYNSLMHYDAFAFSANDLPTIEKASGGHDGIGQRSALSSYDISQLSTMYSCETNSIAGTGCVDLPDDSGTSFCDTISHCGGAASEDCCICGGGLEIQCYEGEECPQAPENNLPPPPEASCIDTYIWTEGRCIYKNTCDYAVQFTCESFGCTMNPAANSGWWIGYCNDEVVQDPCYAPEGCTYWS